MYSVLLVDIPCRSSFLLDGMTNPQQRLRELLKQQPFYLAAAVCFGLGVFLHWFLVVSFLLILPPLHDDIERMRLTLLQPEPSPESDEPAEVKTIPPAPKASPKAARRRAPSTTRYCLILSTIFDYKFSDLFFILL